MRNIYALPLTTFVLFATATSHAQCDFDPTITPSDLILCPNEQGTLTTQVYDSYQWYKAGAPLAGETGPTFSVNAFNDAAYYFKVEATLNGCTEMSPEVLVDGWAFLPPFVMTSDNYLFIDGGAAVFCEGDTARLILMPPYDINIQWTNNGVPIPGATDDTLMIFEPGNFHVSGATSICPDFIQQLGVTVPIDFQAPIQPVISISPEDICADPPGLTYQWYNNGVPVEGMTTQCPEGVGAGVWTVTVVYDPDCSIPSEPFIITAVDEDHNGGSDLMLSPVPTADHITLTSNASSPIGAWRLLDATGRIALKGDGLKRSLVNVDVSMLRAGAYWLQSANRASLPVIIAR